MLALDGIRVIEFASLMSGPYAGLQLADLGAEVVKVEPPEGDMTRRLEPVHAGMSSSYYNLNRGKRSVVLNLREAAGREVAQRLVASADVCIENWRPGVAERLGLASTALRERSPALVTVSVRGFGETGPYAHDRVYDSVIQAVSGLAATQGDHRSPEFIRTYVPDKLAALAAAQGVLAALVARGRTGSGCHVAVSMLDAAIAFQWPDVLRAMTFPSAAVAAGPGPQAPRLGSLDRAGDGRWLTVSAVSDREWSALCGVIGRPDLLAAHATVAARKSARDELAAAIAEYVGAHPRDEVLELLRRADVPCAPVNAAADLAGDPQVVANGSIVLATRDGLGPVWEPAPLVRVGPDAGLGRPAPWLDADTDAVLAELGLSGDEIAGLRWARAVGARADGGSAA